MCGTAVVIGPIGSVTYKDTEIVPLKPQGELSLELHKKLVDIQVIGSCYRYSMEEFLIHSRIWLTKRILTTQKAMRNTYDPYLKRCCVLF